MVTVECISSKAPTLIRVYYNLKVYELFDIFTCHSTEKLLHRKCGPPTLSLSLSRSRSLSLPLRGCLKFNVSCSCRCSCSCCNNCCNWVTANRFSVAAVRSNYEMFSGENIKKNRPDLEQFIIQFR